jgi:hypothetical protein
VAKTGKKVANGDDQSNEVEMAGNKGVCTMNIVGKDVQNTETGAPV